MRIADSCRVTEEVLESEGLILERFLRSAGEPYLGLSFLSKSMGSMIKDCYNPCLMYYLCLNTIHLLPFYYKSNL